MQQRSNEPPPYTQARQSQEQLATACRKHFNSLGLNEQDTIAKFLYVVRSDREGRDFRLRFHGAEGR